MGCWESKLGWLCLDTLPAVLLLQTMITSVWRVGSAPVCPYPLFSCLMAAPMDAWESCEIKDEFLKFCGSPLATHHYDLSHPPAPHLWVSCPQFCSSLSACHLCLFSETAQCALYCHDAFQRVISLHSTEVNRKLQRKGREEEQGKGIGGVRERRRGGEWCWVVRTHGTVVVPKRDGVLWTCGFMVVSYCGYYSGYMWYIMVVSPGGSIMRTCGFMVVSKGFRNTPLCWIT